MAKRLNLSRIRARLRSDELVGFDLSRANAKPGAQPGKPVKIGIKKTGVTKLGIKKHTKLGG